MSTAVMSEEKRFFFGGGANPPLFVSALRNTILSLTILCSCEMSCEMSVREGCNYTKYKMEGVGVLFRKS